MRPTTSHRIVPAALARVVAVPLMAVAACSSPAAGPESARSSGEQVTPSAPIVGLAGKCLDASGGSSADGTKVQLWDCNGTIAQQWTIQNGQILGPGGKCLDATGDTSAAGTPLELWDCWGGPNQQWSVQGDRIVGDGGQCVDVRWAGTADGTQVQLWDCNGTPAQQWTVGAAPPAADGGSSEPPVPALCNGRSVVFRDDFEDTTLDATKWNTSYAWGGDGCCTLSGNGEQEWYTPGQVQVHDGALHLVAIAQPTSGLPYASGMISSGPTQSDPLKYDFQYGYFEARVNIPAGQGLWPAFWTGNSDMSWPPEMDVMEILGNAPGTWYGTVHYVDGNGQNQGDGTAWQGPDFSQGWHTFGVDWQPGQLVWYVDGAERKRVTTGSEVQSKRAYLMANLAVGGYWPGDANASTALPADYQVDYIVVCQ